MGLHGGLSQPSGVVRDHGKESRLRGAANLATGFEDLLRPGARLEEGYRNDPKVRVLFCSSAGLIESRSSLVR